MIDNKDSKSVTELITLEGKAEEYTLNGDKEKGAMLSARNGTFARQRRPAANLTIPAYKTFRLEQPTESSTLLFSTRWSSVAGRFKVQFIYALKPHKESFVNSWTYKTGSNESSFWDCPNWKSF
jgi:hypothetical protein